VEIAQKASNRPENVEIDALPFILPAGVALTNNGRKLKKVFAERSKQGFNAFSGAVIMDYTHE
jgi:hypothetical protein